MTESVYHELPHDEGIINPRIHPSLLPHLLNVTLHQLTPEEARKITSDNAESVLGDFVRKARIEGIL